jgi:hypothetical protein|tara:strand:- start:26988 stop:27719 length:732 start_codon:yes stop_codon:yes gene_type:complete
MIMEELKKMNKEGLTELKEKIKTNEPLNGEDRSLINTVIKNEMARHILEELGVEGDVIAMYPYGSRVYGTATEKSDRDYIIVMKGAMLDNGAFRNNAISNEDWTIQGVVYSRGGFLDAINNYEIAALECLSLDPSEAIISKWPFKVTNWNNKAMVKAIIRKASDSRHYSKMASKNGDKERAIKSMFHALRILHFGLQLKEHQKIVDFQECNPMYEDFMKIKEENFDSRNYFRIFDELVKKLKE